MLGVVTRPLDLPPLPLRATDAHKGDLGTVLVVAGCSAYPGAAILASLGAGRMGAGYVRLAVPSAVTADVLPAVPFAVLVRGASDEDGAFSADAVATVLKAAEGADAVVVGPGLGMGRGAGALVDALVHHVSCPLVIDADGLNRLAASGSESLSARPAPTVLTPHPGEFARLTGRPTPRDDAGRASAARDLAGEWGAVVVLKGARTVTTDGERLRVETAGNAGMATAGMGDVLAGATAALLARIEDPAGAAALAVHLHATAGDLAAEELGVEAVLPVDVAERLGRAARDGR